MGITIKSSSISHVLYAALCISGCLAVGKILFWLVGGLPGSLYGMILFAVCLHRGLMRAEKIKPTIHGIMRFMGVCFVPAGVGMMDHLSLLQNSGAMIAAIIALSTLMVIATVGLVAQHYFSQSDHKRDTN